MNELDTYINLCATCTACNFMPKQDNPRTLQWGSLSERPLVLVIDDGTDMEKSLKVSTELLPTVPFTLTSSIRCDIGSDLSMEQIVISVYSCSVWTKPLLEGRKIIISTEFGLYQMGIKGDHRWGDILKSPKYGYILYIPDLHVIEDLSYLSIYKPKVNRLLKECNLL